LSVAERYEYAFNRICCTKHLEKSYLIAVAVTFRLISDYAAEYIASSKAFGIDSTETGSRFDINTRMISNLPSLSISKQLSRSTTPSFLAIMTVATEPIRSSAAGASVVFQPVPVPNARIVDGNTFPLALSISKTSTDSAPLTVDEAAAAIRDVGERKILKDLLDKHGAVLIRGIGNPTPETFSKLIIAAREGMGRQPYEQIGFSGSRTDVDKEVFSASEAPPNVKIFQHSEVRSLLKQ
jgi:hypothetical protein